eukprot:CAMPEP_0173398792 /NCGR_PEP_ID=MMETSP1356-20130122/42977_1 /TAXON_ID=77927 ORGANISM="Hemiselmis virescens, Strain PCC157" /NCGR_SAMPLE_ID=MMETSP1356 /ASSEMBLY_ACC=CAM_ASM_000847 /LENGTH=138 /DNA_ID=CAMNT_0014358373 /DNA_START=51 /DNA_END=463 /DNA_ORIENTATION=+
MNLVKEWPSHPDDSLIVVGDISHKLDVIEETLGILKGKYADVFFVPGNHELWVDKEKDPDGTSLKKFEQIMALCDRLGVRTKPALVGDCWVVPLFSFYDRSLDLTCTQPELLSAHGGHDLKATDAPEELSMLGEWAAG